MKPKQTTRQWSEIGWQGIRLPVLADWHLARVHGTREKGYIRVDDDERVRAEIRWEKPAKRPERFDRIVDRMLAQMQKLARKKGGFTIKRGVRLSVSQPGRKFECFETRGDGVSYGCLMRCGTCGRVVLGRVLGTSHEDLRSTAGRMFGMLTDHPGADGLDRWDVYGLKFALPPEFALQETKMRTGALEMRFSHKKKEVDIRRLALAGVVLKDCTLRNFFINYCYKDLKAFNYEAEEIPVRDHPGVGLTGSQSLRTRMLTRTIIKRYVHAFSWLCDDRIYIFRMVTPLAEDPQFFDFAGRIECHT